MISVRVLFPSSPPKNSTRLEQSTTLISAQHPDIRLSHPRYVRPREKGNHTDYLAGPDEDRCTELVDFLTSDADHIAWFGRGGYGATRLLTQLKKSLNGSKLTPKRWMGYSDISALFAFVKSESLPIECIHGPMVCAFSEQPNPQEIKSALEGNPSPVPVSGSVPDDHFCGTIWGGNLAVIASLAGTPWLPKLESSEAFFFEDVDEAPYRIDRYLTQLADAGFFESCRQVFTGTFTQFEPAPAVEQVVNARCRELGLNILGKLPIGHSEPHSPLFLDRPYRLDIDRSLLVPQFKG